MIRLQLSEADARRLEQAFRAADHGLRSRLPTGQRPTTDFEVSTMRKNLIFLGLLATLLLVVPAFSGQGQAPANDEQAVRKASAAHLAALNKGELASVMAFWAPDADYIDETGKATRGHDALTALFKTMLTNWKGSKIGGKVYSVKFLRPDVAIEDGSLETTAKDGTRDSNRYAVVWTKSGDRWLISSARDLPAEVEDVPSLSYPQLKSLEWLVGDWVEAGGKGTVQVRCHWAPNKSFLLMEYEVKSEGADPLLVTQRIGWDPVNSRVRSWVFDSTGGFGEGYWQRDGHKWVVGTSAILADGGIGGSTNIYEFKDENTFNYRSVDRDVDGQPVADVEAKFVRKPAK
jgi:uncharacterized protein (TIGR02246 family)